MRYKKTKKKKNRKLLTYRQKKKQLLTVEIHQTWIIHEVVIKRIPRKKKLKIKIKIEKRTNEANRE